MMWSTGPPSSFWHMYSMTLLATAPSWAISSTEKLWSTRIASMAAPSMPTTAAPTTPSMPPTKDRRSSFTLVAIVSPRSSCPSQYGHRLDLAVGRRLRLQQQPDPLQAQAFLVDEVLDPADEIQVALAEEPVPAARAGRPQG